MLSAIAELPPIVRNRYSNMLCHFMVSNATPDFTEILPNTCKELITIINNNLIVDGIGEFKIRVICFISDSPARSKFLNTLQYNGKYGCLICLNPGTKEGGRYLYLYSTTYATRTKSDYEEQVKKSIEIGDRFKGIKGPCFLSNCLEIPTQVVLDIMHACFQGTFKDLMEFWLSKNNSKRPFYISKYKTSQIS